MSDTQRTVLTVVGFRRLMDAIDRQLSDLNRRKDEVLARCPHKSGEQELRYHPDPSGNNDSWYECPLCFKDVGRKERDDIATFASQKG